MTETIWIIGAGDGVGAALAQMWSGRGAKMILSGGSEATLHRMAETFGPLHRARPAEITDRAALTAVAEELAAEGGVDRVIHLDVMRMAGPLLSADPERAHQLISHNLGGAFNVAQIAPKALRKGGQLAITGSAYGHFGEPGGQLLGATAAGVINLVETLHAEIGERYDIRLISPGVVEASSNAASGIKSHNAVTPKAAAFHLLEALRMPGFEIQFAKRTTPRGKFLRKLPYWASLPMARQGHAR